MLQAVPSARKITIWPGGEIDSDLFSFEKLTRTKSWGRFGPSLWMDSPRRCADSANHITSSRQALIPTRKDHRGVSSATARNEGACRRAVCVSLVSDFLKRQGRDGMSLLEGIIDSPNNPLAVVENVATDNNLSFERSGEDEIMFVSK